MIDFVKRSIGYSLTGDTSEQCFFICHGRGENGKTTQIQTIMGLLSNYAMGTPTKTLMIRQGENIPNDVARLKGARFVAAIEGEEGQRLAEALIKQMTGGDTLSARFMRGEFFDFLPEFKLWLATNHRPRIRGTDRAIWRRIRLIPFTVTIPKEEQDRQLAEKLREEWPGILSWAVQGCLSWQKYGLEPPPEVVEATDAYPTEQDTIGAFLAECCTVDADVSVEAKALYDAYRGWADGNGIRPLSNTNLWERLRERDLTDKRGTRNRRVWLGVGLA